MNTNLDEIIEGDFETSYNAISQSYNNLKGEINNMGGIYGNHLNKLPNTSIKKKVEEYKPKYFTITWRMYRTASLVFIFLMFFVLRYFAIKFEKNNADDYILSVYNIFSVFLLLNICVFCFRFVFKKYRETVIGKKGMKGKRGKRGNQGDNDYCNITKPKIAKFKNNIKNSKVKEIIVDNKIIKDTKINKKYNYKWNSVGSGTVNNKLIGVSSSSSNKKNPINNNIIKENYNPIIGVQVNFNEDSEAINKLQYLVDKNKLHNNKFYNYDLFAKNNPSHKNGYGDFVQNNSKGTFQCPPNSAIYKIEGAYNNEGLKGVKYYCADIQTGKSVKSYDMNNKKVFGASFGVEPDPNNNQYYYDKIECNSKQIIGNTNKSLDKLYPSFISSISSDVNDEKLVENIKVNGCSVYSPYELKYNSSR